MNRREMLGVMGAAAAGLLPAGRRKAVYGYPANETLSVAGLGCGGRFRQLMPAFKQIPNVRLTAVCDVWDDHLESIKATAEPQAFATKDYQAVLERKDIDAVIIAAPDHWHVPMTVDACAAGKDVYVEKPLTHTLAEGPKVIEAQNKHRRVVQVGMQQRSMTHMLKAFELHKAGRFGKIHKVHLTWNRNAELRGPRRLGIDPKTVDWKRFLGSAPDQPFDDYKFRHWRWFWDFGSGILTDLMVHWLDVVHWFLDLDHPAEAATIGDQFAVKDLWETPDTVQTLLRYPEQQVQVYFEGTFLNARNKAMIEMMGTEATLYMDRGRYEIHPEPNRKGQYEELILGDGVRGADFYKKPDAELLHLTNWVECIRSRKRPNAPAEAGVNAAAAAHLGNKALRTNQVAKWE